MCRGRVRGSRRWLFGCAGLLLWLGATAGVSAQVPSQPATPQSAPSGAVRPDVSDANATRLPLAPQPVTESGPESAPESAPASAPASAPESAAEAIPEPLPESVADATTRLTPAQQLARMATALASTEFEGTLVYLHGVHLAALRVTHRLDHGESHESLFALSGPVRALARSGRGVTCVLPNARAIQVRRGAGSMLRPPALDPARLSEHYLIEALGHSRVAGRDTDVIGIIPRDDLRYGYRYFIDRATGLPLKTDLMDSSATPIEQVMFTELDLIPPPSSNLTSAQSATDPPSKLSGNPSNNPLPTTTNGETTADQAQPPAPVAPSRWQFVQLPPGFEVVGQGADAGGTPSPHAEFFLLSDGLASVSVTIETGSERGFSGTRQFGAAHATGIDRDGHQITAVGEVPAATVQAILDGLLRR